MPELPEVETVRRGLQELIVGKKIVGVEFDWPKGFPNSKADVDEFMINSSVSAVRRRAKVLLIELSSEYTIVTHLKMTGQLVYVKHPLVKAASQNQAANRRNLSPESSLQSAELAALKQSSTGQEQSSAKSGTTDNDFVIATSPNERFGAGHPNDSLVGKLPDKSTRVTITFADGSKLFFNDQRKFGWMKLYPTVEVPEIDFMKKVGPEPLEDSFTPEAFAERFKRRAKTSIKAALLDQTVVAGVGNIYADESLWGAKIDPRRLVKDVTEAEFMLLFMNYETVMNLGDRKRR